ncbi:MAG: hypothetical protein ACPF9D_08420, partial [Owenweeksia sp.]
KQGKLLGLFRNFPNHDAAFEFEKYDEVLFLDREGDLKKIIDLLRNRENIRVGKLSEDYAANFEPAQMQEHLLN